MNELDRRAFLRAAALSPLLAAARPPGDDLARQFESMRATDPVGAFKLLSDHPGEAAQKAARPALARQISQDLAAALKAAGEGKAEAVELPLTRAALLSDPLSPEFARQLMRLLFLQKAPRKLPTGCATCKGAGAAPCAACQMGLALGPCTRCDSKGLEPCPICSGTGTFPHHGYKGTVLLTLDHSGSVMAKNDKGKTVRYHFEPQTVTYQMSPCSGGSFSLQTENVVTRTGAKSNSTKNQPCAVFWTEMKMFVFSGRAKIKVNNNKGLLTAIPSQAARRFFADYEGCAGGKVTCDRCAGKKEESCPICLGKGKAMVPCEKCEGTAMIACPTCKGFGDSAWMARVLPAAPDLARALVDQASLVRGWIDDRQRRARRELDLARRLEEARKGADPSAKLTPDYVDIVCPRCKGNGVECEECWGAGRREYYEGTAIYERYALVEKLTRQAADLAKAPQGALTLPPLPESEGAPPVVVAPPKPAPQPLPAGPPPAGLAIPASVDEMVKQADEFHESGKGHLEKSKSAGDNATWIDEGMKALSDFKKAQILYTAAQEKLDETGAAVPRSLLDKFRINMQGLVMARKQVP